MEDVHIVARFGREDEFVGKAPQPVELVVGHVLAGEPAAVVPVWEGVVLLVHLVDHPAVEVSQDGQAVFPGPEPIDHLAGLGPTHDMIAHDNFPIDIVLVHLGQDDIHRRELGMDIRIQGKFHHFSL